jgi:hypothetical protein
MSQHDLHRAGPHRRFSVRSFGKPQIEKLVSEHPDNKEYPKRLAGLFKGSKRLHNVNGLPKDPVKALLTLQKVAALWEKLASDNPNLPGLRSDLVVMHGVTGDFLKSLEQWESARTNFQRAAQLRLLSEHPRGRSAALRLCLHPAGQSFQFQ